MLAQDNGDMCSVIGYRHLQLLFNNSLIVVNQISINRLQTTGYSTMPMV